MKSVTVSFVLLLVLAAWTTSGRAQTASVALTDRKWNLVEVNGVAVKDSNAHVRFDTVKKNTYSGSSSCNFIGGRYKADETNLTFSQSFITRRACQNPEDDKIEKEFLKVFYTTTRFWIHDDELRLYNGDLRILVFKASPGKPD